jgi:hypothetical protein
MSFGLLISLLINTIYKLYALMSSMLSCHSSLSFASFVWKICYPETKTATHFRNSTTTKLGSDTQTDELPNPPQYNTHTQTLIIQTFKSSCACFKSSQSNSSSSPFEQFYEHTIQQSHQMMFTELCKFLPQNSPSRQI